MAYYRMEYFPGKFKLRHKSPSSLQECLYDVQYCSIDDFNCASINVYLDQRLHGSYTTKEEIDKFGLSDDAAGFFIRYLLKDPRYVLAAAEVIIEIPTDIPNTKIYGIKAFDTTSFDPLFGIKILVLFILEVLGWLIFWVPLVGWLLFIYIMVMAVLGIMNALQGNYWEMPALGKYARKINL